MDFFVFDKMNNYREDFAKDIYEVGGRSALTYMGQTVKVIGCEFLTDFVAVVEGVALFAINLVGAAFSDKCELNDAFATGMLALFYLIEISVGTPLKVGQALFDIPFVIFEGAASRDSRMKRRLVVDTDYCHNLNVGLVICKIVGFFSSKKAEA